MEGWNPMKKCLTSIVLTVVMTLCFANLVFAEWPSNMEWEPVTLIQQNLTGYYIWHDSSGIHLRVAATGGEKHIFNGVIETDGRIENLMTKTADINDYSRLSGSDTLKFQLSVSGQGTAISAETAMGAIDFNIFDGSFVKFQLSMDGQKIDANQIYFGKDGWHPNNATFTIYYDRDARVREHIILNWWWPWPWFGPHPHPRPRWR